MNVYSAMVLLVLLHGAAESWALSITQISRLEIHNIWLRCVTSRGAQIHLNGLLVTLDRAQTGTERN